MTSKKEYVPTGETYELRTYADFISLSDEQFAMMLPDFLTHKKARSRFDEAMLMALDLINAQLDPETPIDASQIPAAVKLEECFRWIDDGKHDTKMRIQIDVAVPGE